MEIQEQKQLADSILDKLSFYPDVVLAGGAPRDWQCDKIAKDLDFFFGGVKPEERIDLKISIEQTLGMPELSPITSEKYDDSPFEGWECVIDGQLVQFLLHCKSTKEIIENFLFNSSRISYRNGEYEEGKDFFYFSDYSIMIEGTEEQRYAPDHYYGRMRNKFPNTEIFHVKTLLLKSLGNKNTAVPVDAGLIEW